MRKREKKDGLLRLEVCGCDCDCWEFWEAEGVDVGVEDWEGLDERDLANSGLRTRNLELV